MVLPPGQAVVLLPHGGLRCHKLVSGVTSYFQSAEALVSWCDSSHTWQIQITKECLAAGSFTREVLSELLNISVLRPGMVHQQCAMQVFAVCHTNACKDSYPAVVAFTTRPEGSLSCEDAEAPSSLGACCSCKGVGLALVPGI